MKTIMKKTAAGFLVLWMIFGIFVVSDAPIALAAQSALINTSVISTETFTHGDTISVTCRAKGGSGFYQYGAFYKKTDDTKWTTLQKYGSNSVIRFKPPEQVNYDICTKILDSSGNKSTKYFVLKAGSALQNLSTIGKTSLTLGESVSIKASAKGGAGKYTYAVYYKKTAESDKWITKQAYDTNSSVSFMPSSAGTYDICVKVKDKSGKIAKKYFSLSVSASGLLNTSSVSAASVKLGSKVKVVCSAKGSSGFYNYAVFYKAAQDSKWITKQNYDANNVVYIKPNKAGEYDICVKAKDSKGTIKKKYFTLSVVSDTPPAKTAYNITYYASNNDVYLEKQTIENNNESFYYSEDGLQLQALIVPGYSFKGWYTAQTGGTNVTEIPKGSTGDKVLYAQWEKITYNVTFDSPEVPVPSIQYTVDKGATLTNPSWFGYTFVGWSDNGRLVSSIPPGTTGEITLHANWTSNRNRARSATTTKEPIIIEDMSKGQYIFIYELGTIENVPLSQIEYFGNTQGIDINREYQYTSGVEQKYAETMLSAISNATVRSSGMTLSEEWNKTTSAVNEQEEEIGKTRTRTDGESSSDNTRYYISNGTSGVTSASTSEGNSSAYSSKITNSKSTGIKESYANEHSQETSVKLSNDIRSISSVSDEDSSSSHEDLELEVEHDNQHEDGYTNSYEKDTHDGDSHTDTTETDWSINGEFSEKFHYTAGLSIGVPGLGDLNVSAGPEVGIKLGGKFGQKYTNSDTKDHSEDTKESSETSSNDTVSWNHLMKGATGSENSHKTVSYKQTDKSHSSEHGTTEKDVSSSEVASSRSEELSNETACSQEARFDVSKTSSSSWNTEKSYDISAAVSRSAEISDAVSQAISNRYSYTSTNSYSGGKSAVISTGENQELRNEYATAVEYDSSSSQTIKKSVSFRSSEPGYYRLISAGTAHVFAVVGYDIATNAYFTYTYSILDKERHEYIDYSKESANFNDCENAVLPFEIPYSVNEYIYSVTGRSDGLTVDTETGTITEYNGQADYVVIPQYVSVGHNNNTRSAVRIRKIDSSVFKGNTHIKGVFLSKYISEIPDNAFEGCTSLETVVAPGVSVIGKEAFKDCTSLLPYTVDQYIERLGNNAFRNVPAVKVTAHNEAVADAAICSGARILLLDLSEMKDSFSSRKIETDADTEYFVIMSSDKKYSDLQIHSHARVTLISNMIFSDNTDTPLKLDSEAVILSKVKVQNSPGFSMILEAPKTELYLFETTEFSSLGQNTVLSRNVSLAKANNEVAGTLKVKGNYQICGHVENAKMLTITDGSLIEISEEAFAKMLSAVPVSFDACGGYMESIRKYVTYGQIYGELPTASKSNYSFDGWYTAASGGTKVTSSTAVTRSDSHTLYAHWAAKSMTVSLNANGGSVSNGSKTVVFNNTYGDLPTASRSNYNFDGWYTAASGGTKVASSTAVTRSDNHTLYAHWVPKSMTVSFNGNGGSVSNGSKTVVFNSTYGDLPVPKKDYQNFIGWYTSASGGDKITGSTTVSRSDNHTLYARWENKPVSGWVKADQLPSGAQVVNRKWTYTQKTLKDSRNASEDGYKLAGSEWIWCGSGTQNYASFPDGFDKNNWYYQNWNRQPYSAYENATSKRVVNNTWAGFIYWHWMFDCGGANAYDRAIHKRQGYDDTGCYYYRYFGAFDSRESYTEMGYNLYCNRCGMTTYYNTGRTSYAESQGSRYWFRFDYYTSKYEDYYKLFHYYKEDQKESTGKPTASPTVYNIVEWVQYRSK